MFDSIKVWWETKSKTIVPAYNKRSPIGIVSEPILTIGELFRTNSRRFKITPPVLCTLVYHIKDGHEMCTSEINIVDDSVGIVFTLIIQSNWNYTDIEVIRFSYGEYNVRQGSPEAIYLSGLCKEYVKRVLRVEEYNRRVRSRDADTKRYLATQKDKSILMSLYCKEGI